MQHIVNWGGENVLAKDTTFSHLVLFVVKLCRHWLGEVLIGALNLAIGLVTAFSQFGSILWILCVALLLAPLFANPLKHIKRKRRTQRATDWNVS